MRAIFAILLGALAGALPKDAADWTTYGKNHAGWRFSELAQIHTGNVANLRTAWIYQTGVSGGFSGAKFQRANLTGQPRGKWKGSGQGHTGH